MFRKLCISTILLSFGVIGLSLMAGCDGVQQKLRRAPTVPKDAPEEFVKVWEVYRLLSQEFVGKDKLDSGVLSQAAIDGMLMVLNDPYTTYLPPMQYQIENQDFSGRFEGIGAEVGMSDGKITVIAVMDGYPAEDAGIRPGDVILEVDGKSLDDATLVEAVLLIRGPKGTIVSLGVLHRGAVHHEIITLERGVIPLNSVHTMALTGDVAYIHLSAFLDTTVREMEEALGQIMDSDINGLVLDLRNNPGGLLDVTVQVASQFLVEGLILYEIDGSGHRTDWQVKPGASVHDIPMVVLVNQFSASGAEVLAGALQDHDRAIIVGTKTFGKGSVNSLNELNDGSGLYLTYARWYTPNGRLIEGQGVTPDVVVQFIPGSDLDTQLRQSLQVLQDRIMAPKTGAPPTAVSWGRPTETLTPTLETR